MHTHSTVQEIPELYYEVLVGKYKYEDTIMTMVTPPGRPYPVEITTIKLVDLSKNEFEISVGIDREKYMSHLYVFKKPIPYAARSGVEQIFQEPILLTIYGGRIKGIGVNKYFKNQLYVHSECKATRSFDPFPILAIIFAEIAGINSRIKLPVVRKFTGLLLPISTFKTK